MITVKNKDELKKIIEIGNIPLNTIDTSLITDMSYLFKGVNKINGSISEWDVSNVTNMSLMFVDSELNDDISKWDTSNVITMSAMFYYSKFVGDISSWHTSKVKEMNWMFKNSLFDGNISKWNLSSLTTTSAMFMDSKFNQDISSWDIRNVFHMGSMFERSNFNHNLGAWNLSEKNIHSIFENSTYTEKQYLKDRKNYLSNLELEKNRLIKEENDKLINETKAAINKDLNRNIDLDTLEMEF